MSSDTNTDTDDTNTETDLGLNWYVSSTPGVGGEIKTQPEDFVVDEVSGFDYSDNSEGEYAVVEVRLTGYETHGFARDLSNALGVSRERVSWAGTKDKNAVTTQFMTVKDVSRDEVETVSLDGDGAEIEYLGRSNRYISLGDLKGNRFEIRLRDPENPENLDAIDGEIDDFGGVPNLFGVQRFGSKRPVTHKVGEHILRDDYESAVLEYVAEPYPDEPERTREARRRLKENLDFKEALDYFPNYLGYERAMIHAVVEGDSYEEALESLPSNLRRLFVNAVQSRLFNVILRERYDEGMGFDEAYVGDVVCFAGDEIDGVRVPDTDSLQKVTESNVETVNRHVERGRAFVTAPLVGSETELSGGVQGEIETRVLEEYTLEKEDFDRDDGYGSEGTRRAVLVSTDIEYETFEDDIEFRFALPKGSYATVVLREYIDTEK